MESKLETEAEAEEQTCVQRMLKKDGRRFTKYIESTTAHGVVHIFTGKSIIRRLFWTAVVLAAAGVCLYNISDRIIYLNSSPSSTTISTSRPDNGINFPAVTVCNLNFARRDILDEVVENITHFFNLLSTLDPSNNQDLEACEYSAGNLSDSLDDLTTLEGLAFFGRHLPEEFIQQCTFMGQPCLAEHFSTIMTRNGLCYTFNNGFHTNGTILRTNGIGVRFGLTMILNAQQQYYSISDGASAGVKIDIYDPNVPPEPFERGIAVGTGANAYIGLRQRQITDVSSNRQCSETEDSANFNFLRDEFEYSEPACRIDCYYTAIANNCLCLEAPSTYSPDNPIYQSLPACGIEDSCCAFEQVFVATSCDCIPACNYTVYDKTISYATFPASYIIDEAFEDVFSQENSLSLNIYYESLNMQQEMTSDAYGVVALLSDIGGQLGLFLGASVISVGEFLVWLFDEGKDRCCCCHFGRKKKAKASEFNLSSYVKK